MTIATDTGGSHGDGVMPFVRWKGFKVIDVNRPALPCRDRNSLMSSRLFAIFPYDRVRVVPMSP